MQSSMTHTNGSPGFPGRFNLTTEFKGREVSEDRGAELVKQSKEAHEEISKACDVGRFLLSDKAVSILDEFKNKYDNQPRYEHWWESLQENWWLVASP